MGLRFALPAAIPTASPRVAVQARASNSAFVHSTGESRRDRIDHCTEEFDGDHQHERQRHPSHNSEKCTESSLHLSVTLY